jgi:plasmid maintenance system killer protein
MEISYKSNRLMKSLTDDKDTIASYGERAKKIRQRVMELKAAGTLEMLKALPAAACHPLSGQRSGQLAVTITGNWRLVFEPDHDPIPLNTAGIMDWAAITKIRILEITDYH